MKKIYCLLLIVFTTCLASCELGSSRKKITFDTDGGNKIQAIYAEVGSYVELPVPVKDGYTFLGWYDGTSTIMNLSVVLDNITLIARWEIIVVINLEEAFTSETYRYEIYNPLQEDSIMTVKRNGNLVYATDDYMTYEWLIVLGSNDLELYVKAPPLYSEWVKFSKEDIDEKLLYVILYMLLLEEVDLSYFTKVGDNWIIESINIDDFYISVLGLGNRFPFLDPYIREIFSVNRSATVSLTFNGESLDGFTLEVFVSDTDYMRYELINYDQYEIVIPEVPEIEEDAFDSVTYMYEVSNPDGGGTPLNVKRNGDKIYATDELGSYQVMILLGEDTLEVYIKMPPTLPVWIKFPQASLNEQLFLFVGYILLLEQVDLDYFANDGNEWVIESIKYGQFILDVLGLDKKLPSIGTIIREDASYDFNVSVKLSMNGLEADGFIMDIYLVDTLLLRYVLIDYGVYDIQIPQTGYPW